MTLSESVFLSHIIEDIAKDIRKCLDDLTANMHEIRVDISKIRGQRGRKPAFEMPESLDRWEKLLPDAVLPMCDVLDEFGSLSETIMRSAEGGDTFVSAKPKATGKKRR